VLPEIIKIRPVVVICTMKRSGLLMVVPLSTTPPSPVKKYHHLLAANPVPGDKRDSWAKCDMVTSVRLDRLDRHKTNRRTWITLSIGVNDLIEIRKGVAIAAHVQLGQAAPTQAQSPAAALAV
jgi:uncharacterized protein YifN (PemK superfamily)